MAKYFDSSADVCSVSIVHHARDARFELYYELWSLAKMNRKNVSAEHIPAAADRPPRNWDYEIPIPFEKHVGMSMTLRKTYPLTKARQYRRRIVRWKQNDQVSRISRDYPVFGGSLSGHPDWEVA